MASTRSTRWSGRPPPRPDSRSRSRELVDVLADLRALPERGVTIHTDRLIYAVTAARRRAARPDRPADRPGPVRRPRAELPAYALRPFTADRARAAARPGRHPPRTTRPTCPPSTPCPGRTGCPGAALRRVRGRDRPTRSAAADPDLGRLPRRRPLAPARRRHRLRRAAGRGADPRAGRGDRPARPAAARCSAWPATATRPRSVPEGYPIDWHGVRAFYRVMVDRPTRPRVHDRRRLDLRRPVVRAAPSCPSCRSPRSPGRRWRRPPRRSEPRYARSVERRRRYGF